MLTVPVRRWWLAALAVILAAAFALRLWNLGTQSLWHDEAWSVFSAYQPLAWGNPHVDPNAPPIFYLTLSLWIKLAGDSVWAMRYWSLLYGVILVAVVALITRRWFGAQAALLAAIFVAFSPILWVFSQEIRAYVAMPLLALILLILAEALLRRRSGVPIPRRIWLWILLIELVTLYVHNLSVPIVAWLNVTVVFAWALRREWRRIGMWLVAQAVLLALYAPWLITQRPTGTVLNTPPTLDWITIPRIWGSYFTGVKAFLDDGGWALLAAIIGAFMLIFVVETIRLRHDRKILLLLSQVLLIPLFSLLELFAAHIDFHPRYFIVGTPATLILLAVSLITVWKAKPRRTFAKFALAVTCIALVAISISAIGEIESNPRYQHDNFREIAERYAKLSANDAIIIPYGWEPTLDYYSQKMAIQAHIVGIPLGSSWETIRERLDTVHANHIEVLTWYQLPADMRGAYSCALNASSDDDPQSFSTYGLTTTGYDHLRPIVPSILDNTVTSFQVFDRNSVSLISGAKNVCVISDWVLREAADYNYRLAVVMYNPLGGELVHSDTDLRDDRQQPSGFWHLGQTTSAFNLLTLPAGTPSGQYALRNDVYRYSGYDYFYLMGKDTLPPINVTPSDDVPDDLSAQAVTLTTHLKYVVRDAQSGDPLWAGLNLPVSLLWLQDGAMPPQSPTLELRGTNWHLQSTSELSANRRATLSWYQFTVPPQATGEADLVIKAADGTEQTIRHYQIANVDHVFTAPLMQIRVGAQYETVGALAGVDLPEKNADRTKDFPITLYWQASEPSSTAYTVFVHLLDANGQVIAQSDAQPAQYSRPTTGWIKGEYIVDEHRLSFSRQDYTGPATLEVGLYDPLTGKRVSLEDGNDHVVLPVVVDVR